MNAQLVAYNALPLNASSTPGANAVPITDSSGNLNIIGATVSVGQSNSGDLNLTALQTIAANATVGVGPLVHVNASGGAITVTLPAAALAVGKVIIFKRLNTGSNLPTIAAAGGETIDGASTYTGLSAQYAVVAIISNGTGWDVLFTH